MATDVVRAPAAFFAAAQGRLRRWHDGFGGLFEAERDRWLIWVPVLLGLGVSGYFMLNAEPKLSTGLLLVGLTGALALGVRGHAALARTAVALTIVALGFLAAELRTAVVDAPVLTAPIGPVAVSGRVAEVELQERAHGSAWAMSTSPA
jgi:competence protein ComEC